MAIGTRRVFHNTVTAALACLAGAAGAALAPASLRAQRPTPRSEFRSSLTATVFGRAGAGTTTPASATGPANDPHSNALGCRRVALAWRALSGARRYVVYVSSTNLGPFTPLPRRNACGASQASGPTALVDVEPTSGGATVVHRLYYRVAALDGDGPGARVIDTSDVVPVDLP